MTEFPLVIRTPDRECFSGPAESITVPALNGELGVLAGHLPLLAGLKAGVVHVRTPGGGGGAVGNLHGQQAYGAAATAAGFQTEAAPAAP